MTHPRKDHEQPDHDAEQPPPHPHEFVPEPPWSAAPVSKLLVLVLLIALILGVAGVVGWYFFGFWRHWIENMRPGR
jgi:hypothetical protein